MSDAMERSVLASVLQNGSQMYVISGRLRSDHFESNRHALIYDAMLSLNNQYKPIDIGLLLQELGESGIRDAGGEVYIRAIAHEPCTPENALYYASAVQEDFDRHSLDDHLARLADLCRDSSVPFGDVRESIAKNLLSFAVSPDRRGVLLSEGIDGVLSGDDERGITTGFIDLDKITGGFQRGRLITIGASTSMGKSSLSLNCMYAVQQKENLPTIMVTMEMDAKDMIRRTLSLHTKQSYLKVTRPSLMDKFERDLFKDWGDELKNSAAMDFEHQTNGTVADVAARVKMMQAMYGDVGLVVVDYLQLLRDEEHQGNRTQEVTHISHGLKRIAQELNVTVVAPAQLSREVDRRAGHVPQSSDLRESGSIEQDSDQVWLLTRPGYYDPECDEKNLAHIYVTKNRNGPTGRVTLFYHAEQMRFVDAQRMPF